VEIFDPSAVDSDLSGTSPFERENAKIASGHERHCAGTTPATPRRCAETGDKTKKVI
jgi:hypothetical protein